MLFGFALWPKMYGGTLSLAFRSAVCFVILLNAFLGMYVQILQRRYGTLC
jgi:hypothetical protein